MYYSSAAKSFDEIVEVLAAYRPQPQYPHDAFIKMTVEEAVAGAREGNFAVGACLVDADGTVVERAHNQMFYPYSRSDLHAEMNLITKFEDRCRNIQSLRGYTLFTSLESCPMCVVREITAGIGRIYHAAPDAESGMACMLERLTPVWLQLAERVQFAEADCAPLLKELAQQAWLVTANERQARVSQR